jgi:hypothetical protein
VCEAVLSRWGYGLQTFALQERVHDLQAAEYALLFGAPRALFREIVSSGGGDSHPTLMHELFVSRAELTP